MNRIRALLFDMDGVVIDSNPLHYEAWTLYNRLHGIETSGDLSLRISGKRNDQVVRDFFGTHLKAEEIDTHGHAKEALYRSIMRDRIAGALVPGIADFFCRTPAFPAALVTNAEPANVDFVLDGFGLRPHFRAVVTGADVVRPKPYPDIYLRAAEILEVEPGECIVFEDSPVGVAAGLSAGMRVVGIATTDRNLEGASIMIANFKDPALTSWLSCGNAG